MKIQPYGLLSAVGSVSYYKTLSSSLQSSIPCYELACPVFSGYQTVSTQDKQLGSQLWALPLISQHSILFYSTQWTFMANSVPDQIKQYRI